MTLPTFLQSVTFLSAVALRVGAITFTFTFTSATRAQIPDDGKAGWTPPIPEVDEWDWIQMDSGEWLKGEIRTMYNNQLDFESDEFDEMILDFRDIAFIRSGDVQMVNMTNRNRRDASGPFRLLSSLRAVTDEEVVTGFLRIEDGQARVIPEDGSEERVFPKDDIISFAAGEPREINFWSAKVTLGSNARQGNVNQGDLSTRATIRRRTPNSQFYFQYIGTFSQTEDVQTANNHRVTTYYDWFLSRDFFWRIANAEYYKDPFQNIEARGTMGTSFGWHIKDTDRFEWDVAGGPAIQYLVSENVEPGQEKEQTNPAITLSTNFDWELTRRIDLVGNYSVLYAGETAGGYIFHSDTTFETELSSWLDLDVSFILDYTTNPVATNAGTPENADFQVITSLGIDL